MFQRLGLGLWCLTPFQQYFSYIMAVTFIGGENHDLRQTSSHIVASSIPIIGMSLGRDYIQI